MTSVRVEQLYKVFGPHPAEVVRRLKEGADEHEIRAMGATAAVIDATFTVRESETFVVMGLSGCGKSTLIRMLNGLLTPTVGRVLLDEHDITGMSGKALRTLRQQKMSMVFQHFALFPHRTVLDNVGYGLQIQGTGRDEIRTKAGEALGMVGLEGWEENYPQQLSGGMRQRVGLARALAAGTDMLLMDEAFSALDPLIKREMQDQLVQLQAKLGKTIIFITHDLNEAMRLGDRIAVMRAGRLVQIGTAEQILNEPVDDYVAEFVRDVDRSRVLTAGSLCEPVVESVTPDLSPAEALLCMRRHGTELLYTRDGGTVSVLSRSAAEEAHREGHRDVRAALVRAADPVESVIPMNELFPLMHGNSAVLPVVDQSGGILGVVTPEVLFQALSQRVEARERNNATTAPEEASSDV